MGVEGVAPLAVGSLLPGAAPGRVVAVAGRLPSIGALQKLPGGVVDVARARAPGALRLQPARRVVGVAGARPVRAGHSGQLPGGVVGERRRGPVHRARDDPARLVALQHGDRPLALAHDLLADYEAVAPGPRRAHVRAVGSHRPPDEVPLDAQAPGQVRSRADQVPLLVIGVGGDRPVRAGHGGAPPGLIVGQGRGQGAGARGDQSASRVPLQAHVPVPAVHTQRAPGWVAVDAGQDPPVRPLLAQPADGVVEPCQLAAVRLQTPRDAARLIVGQAGGAAQRVSDRRQAPHRVVLAAREAASGVGDGHQAADLVPLQAGHPAQRIGDRDDLPRRVVTEAPGAVPGVRGPHHAPAPVIGQAPHPGAGLAPAHGPPALVEGRGHPLAGRPDLADDIAVGIVDQLIAGPARGHGGAPAPALIVLVGVGAPVRQDDIHQPSGGVIPVGGLGPQRIHRAHHSPAPVVVVDRGRPVRAADRLGAAQAVIARRPGRLRVGDPHRLTPRPGADGPLASRGIHHAPQAPHGVVLQPPGAARRVREGGQPRQGVVREVPGAAVGQRHPRQVPQVVDVAPEDPSQRILNRLLLAAVPVVDPRAPAQRVDAGHQTATRRVLEAPHGPVGIGARHAHARTVVGEAGPVPQRGYRGHHPPGAVALQTGGVADGVGGSPRVWWRV